MSKTKQGGPLLTAEWSHMAVMNFIVEPSLLTPMLPDRLQLSSFQDKHLLSLVGFHFQNTRIGSLPVPFYGGFFELYLGFFAERNVGSETRRGWVFVRKIVPSRVVATVGRLLYNEDYITRPMRMDVSGPNARSTADYVVSYEWLNNKRWNRLSVVAEPGDGDLAAMGSLEHFFTNNYGGFAKKRGGGSIEFPVIHPDWKIWRGTASEYDCDIEAIYGDEFVTPLSQEPCSVFIASGSKVTLGKASAF